MTLVWGLAMLAQTALACVLVFSMPIKTYLLVSPFAGYAVFGALAIWTFWYGQDGARRHRAAQLRDGPDVS